jgi:hypothetical protein
LSQPGGVLISVEDWAEIHRLSPGRTNADSDDRKEAEDRDEHCSQGARGDAPPKWQAPKASIVDAIEPQIRELPSHGLRCWRR